MMIGGSTEIAARRAARLRLPFFPAIGDPALADTYRAECEAVGFEGGWVSLPNGPGMVMVSEDPDKTWAQIGPHALFDAQTYAGWQTPGQRSAVHVNASDADDPERNAPRQTLLSVFQGGGQDAPRLATKRRRLQELAGGYLDLPLRLCPY